MAYLGTRFLATKEATISDEQKRMTVDARAADIFYTSAISGVAANFLRPSLVAAGLDPDNLVSHGTMDLGNEAKAWKTVWSAGQGVASLKDVPGAAELCERLIAEYKSAMERAGRDPFAAKAQTVSYTHLTLPTNREV